MARVSSPATKARWRTSSFTRITPTWSPQATTAGLSTGPSKRLTTLSPMRVRLVKLCCRIVSKLTRKLWTWPKGRTIGWCRTQGANWSKWVLKAQNRTSSRLTTQVALWTCSVWRKVTESWRWTLKAISGCMTWNTRKTSSACPVGLAKVLVWHTLRRITAMLVVSSCLVKTMVSYEPTLLQKIESY